MATYTTIQGDTWDVIALKALGSEKHTSRLINANIQLADTLIFSAGTVLQLPEISIQDSATLPPWRK